MRNLIAAVYFVLALFGCNGGGTTLVTRATIDGAEAIHSQIRIKAGIAHFECIASSSGECHYTLFPGTCASGSDCTSRPMERFVMATGASREIVGLPEFGACVTQDDVALTKDCRPRPQAR